MPSPAVEATCDGAVAVPLAGKPCGKAGSMSRLCSKGSILPLDFLSTKLVINSQGDRKGTPLQYTRLLVEPLRVWYGRTLAVALVVFHHGGPIWQQHVYRYNN